MKKKNNVLKRYIEAIIACIMLVVGIFMCISGNIFVKMIPIAFIIGIVGNFVFDKKIMTSFFAFILALVWLQIRIPSQLIPNVMLAVQIGFCSVLGELCGVYLRILRHQFKLKKRKVKEVIKGVAVCSITLIFALIINSIISGNIFSYMKAKRNLENYFITEYSSSSRFKITSSKYIYTEEPGYVFYTQDILSNNEGGKFTVYLNSNLPVQDDYKGQVLKNISNNISQKIQNLDAEELDVKIFYDEIDTLTISFNKVVDSVTKEAVELYSKQIAEYMAKAKEIPEFNSVEQIKIILESKKDSKENLASYIYMEGYNQMLINATEEPYEYIIKALNIVYFE